MSDQRLLAADVQAVEMVPLPLDPADVEKGSPEAGYLALAEVTGAEVGIWELSEGVVRDTEVEEPATTARGPGSAPATTPT
ncbi:hypothetical protein [Nocardioides sp.]|uniref:hypothetical protein n=1 Tax=Nocardioides sp. TaxID=35761 RepID=UPI0035651235